MRQSRETEEVETRGPGFYDLTPAAHSFVERQGVGDGLLTVFIHHTSASLLIQENADPDVQRDLLDALARLAPEDAGWRHRSEGPDDMPAHVKGALTQTHLQIPVAAGRLDLGTWQGIYLVEHRARPHRRRLTFHLIGD
ncbi:MAG: secondary thiamine-phosphate synthase enzyme YjbQ [Geminicoccaceae bacterium]|nr:secondary thiamine-phosphate synthase enzyme YjbQ [Geminicoccaceae bacterium]